MTKTQALVLSRLLYYLQNDEFVMIFDGEKYVQKNLSDWAGGIEIRFQNGKQRKLSKSSVSHAFSALIKLGFATCKYHAKVRCFGVDEAKILHAICTTFASFLHTNRAIFAPFLHDQTQAEQGVEGNLPPGTYTNTYTNNKSYKSEEKENDKKIPEKDLENVPSLPQQTVVQDMFEIWRDEFPENLEKMNLKTASWLKAAYDSSFDGDLRAWRNYLRKAKTSEFIMDRPHLLGLKWLLSFETINNISRGAYDVTEPELDMAEVEAQRNAMGAELSQQIEDLNEPEICKKQRLKILGQIGPFAYKAWFSKVSMDLRNGEIKCSGTDFNLDRIAERYGDLLKLESENLVPAEKVVAVEHLPNLQSIRPQISLRLCHG